jgi:hypothetical protein
MRIIGNSSGGRIIQTQFPYISSFPLVLLHLDFGNCLIHKEYGVSSVCIFELRIRIEQQWWGINWYCYKKLNEVMWKIIQIKSRMFFRKRLDSLFYIPIVQSVVSFIAISGFGLCASFHIRP